MLVAPDIDLIDAGGELSGSFTSGGLRTPSGKPADISNVLFCGNAGNDAVHGRETAGTAEVGSLDQTDFTPRAFSLESNYPNPFNPQTIIRFDLPESADVMLTVWDLLGRHVRTLVDGEEMRAGRHEIAFDGSGYASGVYVVVMEAGNFRASRRINLVK